MTKKLVAPISYAALLFAVALLLFIFMQQPEAKAQVASERCKTTSVAVAGVGNQLTSRIIATSSARAFTRIQQRRDDAGVATSTVYLNFAQDSAATTNSGLQLSTTSPYIDFGQNTLFPYYGSVQGITNTGSTTLLVTQCEYF